jgi:hypothetical protein
MGLQAIEARPKYGSPVFLVDQDTGDMITAHLAVRYGVSFQRVGASGALSSAHRLLESKTVASSRGKSRVVARASVAVAACVLWLFIGAAGDNALCGESDTRAQVFVAAEKRGIAQADARRDESLLISRFVETTVVEQKQIFERGREKVDILTDRQPLTQPLDAPPGKAAQASQSLPPAAWERKQALEHEQEWFARALNSSLGGEPDEVRSAAELERIKQKQSLDQERGRADALARELTSLRSELDAGRIAGQEAVQAIEAEIKQKQALDQERDRADALARELTSLRAELDSARVASPEAEQAGEAEIKQKQALEQERGRADTLARELASLRAELDTARAAGAEAVRAAEAAKIEQEQALGKERDKTETLARELTSLRADLDTARVAGLEATRTAEAAKIEQEQALGKERDKTETLAQELTSLRADLDTARAAGLEAMRTAEAAKIEQAEALGKERGKTETLDRALTSLRAELEASRIAGPEVAQAAAAEIEQKQALKQERDRAEALARELTSLRAELDTARAAGPQTVQTNAAAKIEQELAFGKERDQTERLARELASARKETEARSALLAAVHAEVLEATETNRALAAEQKLALASERDRADALARELTSVRNELEAGNRQIAALNALRALHSHESAADHSQERMAESSSRTTEGKGRSPEQISAEAAASTSGQSSASELPRPEAQSTAREAASDSGPKVAAAIERSTPASAASSRSTVDEQRLLARANALLRQVDINGARLLLEYALERGSARAAFMLAETYDARVLRSWRALGVSGDLTTARELYARAQAGGIEDAKERIETLK